MMSASLCAANEIVYEYEEDPEPSRLILEAVDLQRLGEQARTEDIPILVEFSTPWCSYCEALEQQILEPLIRSKQFEDGVLIRKIEVMDSKEIKTFSGDTLSTAEFASRLKVSLYPTLIMFSGKGEQIAERIVGITVLEFASRQIEDNIRLAQQQLREPE